MSPLGFKPEVTFKQNVGVGQATWKTRFARGVDKVNILRPPRTLAHLFTIASGLGRARESTWTWSGTTIVRLNDCAEFLIIALRRLLGTIGSQGE